MISLFFILSLFILLFSCAVSPPQPADMVLRGGEIATVDDSFSLAEAVAVRGDTLCAVGSNEEIQPYIGPQTTIIEFEGKLVIPGLIDAYEQTLMELPSHDHRFRVEHAQVVSLEDIPRFSASGVLPSMQPTHATSDMYWAEDRVGPERIWWCCPGTF